MNTGNSKFLQYLDRICFVGSILFLSALAAWSIAGRFTALQLPSLLQEWLFPVFTAAAVGYLTNYLAILLLFRPYKPVKWLCGFQGVLPREQAALAKKMGEETKVAVRNHRREGMDVIKKAKTAKEISEDEASGCEADV